MKNFLNTNNKLVSIVIPCYNLERFVKETIESALEQTYPRIEVIVVNDGSTDQSLDVISLYKDRIKIVNQKNSGAGTARNNGVLNATGEYIMFVDADDILSPNTVKSKVRLLESDENIGLIIGRFFSFGESGINPGYWHTEHIDVQKNQFYAVMSKGCVAVDPIYRKEVFTNCGFYDPFLKTDEDYEFYIRVSSKYRIAFDYETHSYYRRYSLSSRSSDMIKNYKSTVDLLKKVSILSTNKTLFWILAHVRMTNDLTYKTLSFLKKMPFNQSIPIFLKLVSKYPFFLVHSCFAIPRYVLVRTCKFFNQRILK